MKTIEHVPNPAPSRAARIVLNVALLAIVFVTPLLWVQANFSYYNTPDNLMDPYTDATTYLAAGERLNAGHDLYRLGPGDRPVLPWAEHYTAPLLSPPPIAVFWRPLAAVDWGIVLWIAACWIAMLGTLGWLVLRVGLPAVLLAFVLSHSIGEQLAVANANAFAPLLYVLLWRYRDRAVAGVSIATMAAIKLAPAVLIAWLIGTRRWRVALTAIVAVAVIFLVSGLGAGFSSYGEWLGTLSTNSVTPISVSGLTGVSWASYAFLVLTGIVAFLTGPRWPRLSFCVAIAGAVLGTPALYSSSLVGLLALTAPLAGPGRGLSFWPARMAPRAPAAAPAEAG